MRSTILPLVYVAIEVSRFVSTEAMFKLSSESLPPLHTSAVILLTELAKLAISTAFVMTGSRFAGYRYAPFFAVNGALYFINNAIYFNTVRISSAGPVLFMCYMRLPLTAILHHFMIRKQPNIKPWLSLVTLFLGVILTQIKPNMEFVSLNVFFLCVLMSMNSAATAIYTEKMLKDLKMEFWEQQACMYAVGSAMAGIYSLGVGKNLVNVAAVNSITVTFTVLVIALSCTTGFVSGYIIKTLDNIIKLIFASIATITSSLLIFLFFGSTQIYWPTFIIGSAVIVASSYAYTKMTDSIKAHAYTHVSDLGKAVDVRVQDSGIVRLAIALLPIGLVTIYYTA